MFTLFTASNFGRGLNAPRTLSPLSAQLATYRRQRARLSRTVAAN